MKFRIHRWKPLIALVVDDDVEDKRIDVLDINGAEYADIITFEHYTSAEILVDNFYVLKDADLLKNINKIASIQTRIARLTTIGIILYVMNPQDEIEIMK